MNEQVTGELYFEAVKLLKRLIAIPSLSGDEGGTCIEIEHFLSGRGVEAKRFMNNVWAVNKYYDPAKPTILLNSHHDTVRANKSYTNDPHEAAEQDGKIYGLGSNDAGGCLVSLIAAFVYFFDKKDARYNLILAASAEEEISGINGIEALLPKLGKVDF